MNVCADLKEVKYTPTLCSPLKHYHFDQLSTALSKHGAFLLRFDSANQMAISRWVSPKRTRSYPYARVYDTLGFSGKKITIIPFMKDEGKDGDRDFVQWDTISLMSLLGVYVVIAYYDDASKNSKYDDKITKQRFNLEHLTREIEGLLSYQSDPLHWNLSQIDTIGRVGQMALEAYSDISRRLSVEMTSWDSAEKRIRDLRDDKSYFMEYSRKLAKQAQMRESVTRQPKEHLTGIKGTLTIKNFLGGNYYWTCDEIEIHGGQMFLIEAKHTRTEKLPSNGDIKDALVKMMLFTNLENLKVGAREYIPISIVKLTTGTGLSSKSQNVRRKARLRGLWQETETNGFRVSINGEYLTLKTLE